MKKPKQTEIQALVSQEVRRLITSYAYQILRELEDAGCVSRDGAVRDRKLTWIDEPTINAHSIDDRNIRQVSAASVRIDMPRYPNAMAWVAGEIGRAA
jgi:hypothetical protein